MTHWTPYRGERYLDFESIEAFCRTLAASHPRWVTVEEVGQTRHGRPLLLLTLSGTEGDVRRRPGLWLDGGTHASEFTSVMATLYAVTRWVEALAGGDASLQDWFCRRAVYVMPCVSPDGYAAMHAGGPFIRSSLRPPPPGAVRSGLDARDIDGDGAVRWMRWRHPAGPFVPDPDAPIYMRPRRLEDDPGDAFFLCDEGEFVQWDGVRWARAPREFSVDLNRNFPGSWAPFSMFGMDGGSFAMSEPESRAVVDAFAARPFIGAALTCHTYTGCMLTQPYRKDTPLPKSDLKLMEHLAKAAVEGTGYDVFRVHPDFTYDPDQVIVGVWADTIATVFGVPGYTLELWNPMKAAGVELDNPLDFLLKPDPEQLREVLAHFCADADAVEPWRPFDHPQLGPVEIGGIDYLRTIRNPPEALLSAECEVGFTAADRLRRALPEVTGEGRCVHHGGASEVALTLDNRGFLPTSGLSFGAGLVSSPGASAELICGEGVTLTSGPAHVELDHLEGWGQSQVGSTRNIVYASLPTRGHRTTARWLVEGAGSVTLRWCAGRAGEGELTLNIPEDP